MAEIGLATAAATANQLKSVLNLLPEEKGRPKFGTIVDPKSESKCPYLDVFMACHGRFDKFNVVTDNMELRRARFKLNDTALDAREKFGTIRGKPVSQEDIKDENGFILDADLLNSPMSSLSHGCRLNLNFVYSRNVISQVVVDTKDEISSTGQKVVNAATNTPSLWQTFVGKSSGTSTTTSSDESE